MPFYLHREIFDLSVAPYLAVYTSYLIGRYQLGTRWLVQSRVLHDHRVDLKINGDHLHIRLWGLGQLYFEFGTTGVPVINLTIESEGISFTNAYKVAIVGVNVSDSGAIKAEIRSGSRQIPMEAASIVERQSQINLFDEPVGYRSSETTAVTKRYPSTIYESFAPIHPYTGVFMRAYNFEGNGAGLTAGRGPWEAHTMRDVAFDVPYQDTVGVQPVRMGLLRGDTDWPRAMGRMRVTHETLPAREFAVYIDGFNQVSVFPLDAIPAGPLTSLDQNIPEEMVKRLPIPLPSWVFKGTVKPSEWFAANENTGLIEFPELDWKLHPDGDRACAVVHERVEANFDAAYFETGVGATPLTAEEFAEHRDNNTGYAARHNGTLQMANLPQRYCIGSGLVELTVLIELTGENLDQYSFALGLNVIRRPTTTPYCTMVAGYVWYDIKADDWTQDNPTYVALRGDMVMLDIERYYRATDGSTFNFFSVKNKTTALEIRTWQGLQLLDFDLPTLSFAISIPGVSTAPHTLLSSVNPAVTVTLDYTVVHPSVMIVTFNKARRVLFPDSIPTEIRNLILERYDEDMRARLLAQEGEWTFMPLNDDRTWATADLANLRDYYCQEIFGYKSGLTPTLPVTALRNWWVYAMYVYLPPTSLFYIDNPRFGWHAYADEIMNRMWLNPESTFFVHPNGSWAFYDNQFIYNKHGFWGPTGEFDSLTPFQEDDEALEHCIFDHVHFETGKSSVESSFLDLYNKAALDEQSREPPRDTFNTVTRAQMRANFDKTTVLAAGIYRYLELKVLWYPHGIFYYPEQIYQKSVSSAFGFVPGGGGLRDLTMGATFNGESNFAGSFQSAYGHNTPITFSSCLMIQS